MALARIWLSLFGLGFLAACYKAFYRGHVEVFSTLGTALMDAAKLSVEISIGLVGVMAFWLGIMRIGEAAGLIERLAKFLSPVLGRLFPGVPPGHPAMGHMVMNLSANMLGLDSAATPLGLKAMQSLQELNPYKDRATDAQLMFTILNSAGVTLIPVSIMVYRAQLGAANPADIFLPVLMGTAVSALSGIIITALLQKINLLHPRLLLPLLIVLGGIGVLVWQASMANQATLGRYSLFFGNFFFAFYLFGNLFG
jgi:spore maturation protein SpmA